VTDRGKAKGKVKHAVGKVTAGSEAAEAHGSVDIPRAEPGGKVADVTAKSQGAVE
jgi:uncharacterized protein YjbJ (UPF0337 family)